MSKSSVKEKSFGNMGYKEIVRLVELGSIGLQIASWETPYDSTKFNNIS